MDRSELVLYYHIATNVYVITVTNLSELFNTYVGVCLSPAGTNSMCNEHYCKQTKYGYGYRDLNYLYDCARQALSEMQKDMRNSLHDKSLSI